jgi:hypothetical protein
MAGRQPGEIVAAGGSDNRWSVDPAQRASVAADSIFIEGSVVTKADLERAEAGLKAEIARSEAALQVEIARVETALRAEITAFRGEVRTNLARMNDGGEQLRATVAGMENRLLLRLGGAVALLVLLGLLFATLHVWPLR